MLSKFYRGNQNLKPTNTDISYSEEQVEELRKCLQDPLYMMENYIKINNLDRGIIPFKPYPYQTKVVDALENNRFLLVKFPRQSGKCVAANTKIKIRNRKTGEISEASIEDVYAAAKSQSQTT